MRFVWDWERDRGCWVGLDWRDEERERVVGVWVGKEAVLMEADMVGVVVIVGGGRVVVFDGGRT